MASATIKPFSKINNWIVHNNNSCHLNPSLSLLKRWKILDSLNLIKIYTRDNRILLVSTMVAVRLKQHAHPDKKIVYIAILKAQWVAY